MLKKEINLVEAEDLQLWNDEHSAFIKKDILSIYCLLDD